MLNKKEREREQNREAVAEFLAGGGEIEHQPGPPGLIRLPYVQPRGFSQNAMPTVDRGADHARRPSTPVGKGCPIKLGDRFGHLVVLGIHHSNPGYKATVRCDCGAVVEKGAAQLAKGKATRCNSFCRLPKGYRAAHGNPFGFGG